MKKLLCILLTFSLAISISVPAFAQENATSERESLLNPDEETMFEQMMRQLPYDEEFLLEEGAISLESLGQPMAIDDKASVQSTTYYYKTLTMPAAMFYIVTVGYRDKDYTSATYNGNECYKFTRGNIIVYVKKTAFCTDSSGKEKSGKIGSASWSEVGTVEYTFNTNCVPSNFSTTKLSKQITLAQHLSGSSLDISSGTTMSNAQFSQSWLYTPSTNHSFSSTYCSEAYRQGPTAAAYNKVNPTYTAWTTDNVTISFN